MVNIGKVLRGMTSTILMSLFPYNAIVSTPNETPKKYEPPRATVLGTQQWTLDEKVLFYILQIDRNGDKKTDMEIIVSPCSKENRYATIDYVTGLIYIDADLDGNIDVVASLHPAVFEYVLENRPQC